MKFLIALVMFLGGVMIYLLSLTPNQESFFAQSYLQLLKWGLGLGVALAILILSQVFLLFRRYRRAEFGSILTIRLAVVFVLMAVLPGSMVYGLSLKFLSNSIESWFDVHEEVALSSGLNLSKITFDSLLTNLERRSQVVSDQWLRRADKDQGSVVLALLGRRFQIGSITVYNTQGEVIVNVSHEPLKAPPAPLYANVPVWNKVQQEGEYKQVESMGSDVYRMRVVFSLVNDQNQVVGYMQTYEKMPESLMDNAGRIEEAYRGYQQLLLERTGLKRLYSLNLGLALLLTLLVAMWMAILVSNYLVRPLQKLALATRAIGEGEYTQLPDPPRKDDLGVLTLSFNAMSRQLMAADLARVQDQQRLQASKDYQESLLSHLSTGILVFSEQGVLKYANHIAIEWLRLKPILGLEFENWFQQDQTVRDLAIKLQVIFEQKSPDIWESEWVEARQVSNPRHFHFRGQWMPKELGQDWILVVDDITELVQAQRSAAWGELARRLAHEIKNPLTPIQWSAERLQMKLVDVLPEAEKALLIRSTQTIVKEVDAIKQMVNEFGAYSQSFIPTWKPININQLILNVVVLYEHTTVSIETELAEGLPEIQGSFQAIQQVLHNLLQNAFDALQDRVNPKIRIQTTLDKGSVVWSIEDNGPGFTDEILQRVFEPYVTTKVKGTGLGLPIVKKIIEDHGGRIQVSNRANNSGASIVIWLPMTYETYD